MSMFSSKNSKLLTGPLNLQNPVTVQILGICSALAVTVKIENAIVMGLSVMVVTAISNLVISLLRNYIPSRIRIIVQLVIVATMVILVDQFLRAFVYDVSKQLSVYVGLIITNCIIMGRAEAYAQANPPIPALLDGIAAGIGYTWVLLGISLIRELMGFGSIFGIQVLGDWWTKWTIMVMPPSAFFILAVFIWVFNSKKGVSK